MDKKEFRL
ncbi:hypothetical protein GWI33_014274, partial [Rhynchophorus ferrugineus]